MPLPSPTLNTLSQKTRLLAEYDKRIQAEKQLAEMYGRWDKILQGQLGSRCTPYCVRWSGSCWLFCSWLWPKD